MTDFGSFELFIYYLFLQSFKLLILQYRIYNVILSINDVSLYCWFDFHNPPSLYSKMFATFDFHQSFWYDNILLINWGIITEVKVTIMESYHFEIRITYSTGISKSYVATFSMEPTFKVRSRLVNRLIRPLSFVSSKLLIIQYWIHNVNQIFL